MRSRLEELATSLATIHPSPGSSLSALRVPPECFELSSVAIACEPALTRLCDHHDSVPLLDARDVIRGILRLLPQHSDLTRNDYASLSQVPGGNIDEAYRALPLQQSTEPWWRETLREALLARLLLDPSSAAIDLLADALRRGLPISLTLHQRQNAPTIRIALLIDCLATQGSAYARLIQALTDTNALLGELPALRREAVHPENAAQIDELRRLHTLTPPCPSPRERLSRLARDIGAIAVAQRREYHAPSSQQLPSHETLHEVVRRSSRWGDAEKLALQACLLLGRMGCHILKTHNEDPCCRIERQLHEVWVERRLPDSHEFTRSLEGPAYAPVGRLLRLPLPRRLGDAVAKLCATREGEHALRQLQRRMRELSRDAGQPVTIRRVTRVFEYELENEAPDGGLMTLLGMQPQGRRDAGIHYFAPSATNLVQHFKATVERVSERHDLDALDEGWSVPPSSPTEYFGYSYRVDHEALRTLIGKLHSLADLGRGRPSPLRVVEAYNARVARLTLMYLAATGSRPTGMVLPPRGDISLDDRAALASEKDSLGYRSTRLVPLCGRLVAEINDFERWASSKNLFPRSVGPDTPLAALLTEERTFVSPTISALGEALPAFAALWPWPDDALRHLFRSRLWELGCPSSWLRRVMGHHPRHGGTDMPHCARQQWDGLHDWSHLIDEHLEALGF